MNRRSLLTSALVVLAAQRLPLPGWTRSALAGGTAWRHGVSAFGDLKYPSGFKQFDYVNANAPKGGAARQIALGTYDNFNMVIDGVKGALAVGNTSEEFQAYVKNEIERWGKVIAATGIRIK